jgi:hypothetical protein
MEQDHLKIDLLESITLVYGYVYIFLYHFRQILGK